mgnify:CR=1 FL=1
MASKVSIANGALERLGEKRIESLTQDDVRARSMNASFDSVRDALLRKYDWGFAIRRASIAADGSETTVLEPQLHAVRRMQKRLGSPFDEPPPFMGPVIDNMSADGLTESFLYMLSHGGRAIKHLKRMHDQLPFVTPAIIDTTAMADRPDVELFGPILQVIRVNEFDEAIAEANNTRFGLTASLIGGTPQEYNRFWANVRAGVVNWNRPTVGMSPGAPQGGVGLSGNHRPGAYYAADYCAYPVSSAELEQPRAIIGAGFREAIYA